MPHRVSHDATEDSPAGHADGNGTGARRGEGCGERDKVSEQRGCGKGERGEEWSGEDGKGLSINYSFPFGFSSGQLYVVWREEEFETQSQVLSSGYPVHFSVKYSSELLFWKIRSPLPEWTSCKQHNPPLLLLERTSHCNSDTVGSIQLDFANTPTCVYR